MCVRELDKKIHDYNKNTFIRTTHKDDWYFSHDTLSQMTTHSTVQWMQADGYYKQWSVLHNGCNNWITFCRSCPVGNSPEFMLLDNSLNNNVQSLLSIHCTITWHLSNTNIDARKFSMATPNIIVNRIEMIWEEDSNVPSLR